MIVQNKLLSIGKLSIATLLLLATSIKVAKSQIDPAAPSNTFTEFLTSANGTKYVHRPPQSSTYQVKMWLVIDRVDDGPLDYALECYGYVRIDSSLYWEIPRTAADRNQIEAGLPLEITDSKYKVRNRSNC